MLSFLLGQRVYGTWRRQCAPLHGLPSTHTATTACLPVAVTCPALAKGCDDLCERVAANCIGGAVDTPALGDLHDPLGNRLVSRADDLRGPAWKMYTMSSRNEAGGTKPTGW